VTDLRTPPKVTIFFFNFFCAVENIVRMNKIFVYNHPHSFTRRCIRGVV
jgi:hypothetical protein